MDYRNATIKALLRELNAIKDSGVRNVFRRLITDNSRVIDWDTVNANLQKYVPNYKVGKTEDLVEPISSVDITDEYTLDKLKTIEYWMALYQTLIDDPSKDFTTELNKFIDLKLLNSEIVSKDELIDSIEDIKKAATVASKYVENIPVDDILLIINDYLPSALGITNDDDYEAPIYNDDMEIANDDEIGAEVEPEEVPEPDIDSASDEMTDEL